MPKNRNIVALIAGATLLGGTLGFFLGRKKPESRKVKIYMFLVKHRKFLVALSAIVAMLMAFLGFGK